jgi:hypothetical protein
MKCHSEVSEIVDALINQQRPEVRPHHYVTGTSPCLKFGKTKEFQMYWLLSPDLILRPNALIMVV